MNTDLGGAGRGGVSVFKRAQLWIIVVLIGLLLQGCDAELERRLEALETQATANAEAGAAFLRENGKKPGVFSTASGLQYRVLVDGVGRVPVKHDRVRVHYRGQLLDGTEFDSSYKRGEAAVFPVAGLIPGWVEALQLMSEGARWEIYVPASLAYGKKSMGSAIPSNSTLIFELELIAIES